MLNVKKISIIIVTLFFIICIVLTILMFLGNPVTVKTDKKVKGLSRELSDILYHASLAPNTHNAQMWKVIVHSKQNQVSIYFDQTRALKEVDSQNREAYISIGAFTKNLLNAFEAYGYDVKYDISKDDNNKEFVRVTYEKKNQVTNTAILIAMKKRHTDKSAYQNREIKDEELSKLIGDKPYLHYFGNMTKEFEYIKKATLKATKLQAYNKDKAFEFSNWLRLSNKETTQSKDGISAEQLGLSGLKKTLYYLTTSHKSAKGDTFAKQTMDTAKKQVNNCAGFLIITGGNSRIELIQSGIKLQETWLNAIELGISVQPMSQILEEKPYCNEVNGALEIKAPIQMILRLGYVKDYGKNNQIRRDLSEFITVED